MPERAHIGLGSNLGDRRGYLAAGLAAVAALPGTHLAAVSSIYETPPLGPADQPDYLNAVCAIDAPLGPLALLAALHKIENQHRRQRHIRWGPRTLDLDLLLYGERVIDSADLQLPHPHMNDRSFVLAPLCEIAPDLHHPLTARPFTAHLAELTHSDAARAIGSLARPENA